MQFSLLNRKGPVCFGWFRFNYAEHYLTLLHSERPKLHTILVFLSAIGLINVVASTEDKGRETLILVQ